ncbi:MAG TPA: secondary thiamine-phosphate synthase enzyme YjbQ [Terriglobia bacterium]|nr:secondary thiamine-phosphate synthase enzyme YjbQ [Terriglobia bacterium]
MGLEVGKAVAIQKPRAHSEAIQIETQARVEFKDITGLVRKCIADSGVHAGVCHVFTPHTSAAVMVQENDDPALQRDFDNFLKQLAPRDKDYNHNDGNCDSHLKASIIGCSKTLLVEDGRLVLGRWQGVFFCEFDGPRRRELRVKVVPD